MRTELAWYRLRWPREVEPEQVTQMFHLLAAVGGEPVILEAVGKAGLVEHRLALPKAGAGNVLDQLRAAIPGLATVALTERVAGATHAVELRLNTRRRSLRTDDPQNSSRALLTALAHLGRGEYLTLQWVLARGLPATAVPNRVVAVNRETWLGALLLAPFSPPQEVDVEARNALRAKQAEPGWCAVGRIGVMAKTTGRERQLVRQVVGAISSTAAPGVSLRVRSTKISSLVNAKSGWRLPLRLNVNELASVSALPVGPTSELPVSMIGSRLLPASRATPCTGRVVAQATYRGREQPLALSATDSLRHLHVLGPTGTGKSTLLTNLITEDMKAGRAVVVIEPKGDLIADVLERVPEDRVNDVVLLDPTDTDCPVGLNPLVLDGRPPELVADQLLGMFHALYSASWGPRTADILGASLLSLARIPGMTLAALVPLLTDASFRRRIVAQVDDPIGLGPFWSSFDAWSDQERVTATAPVLNKLRPLLLRPEMRLLIGQAHPRFRLKQVFTERKILLVNLSRGSLGPETSALLGSLIVSQLWQAVLGRSVVPRERRHPVFVVLDEFQDYLRLPVDLADALAQARGLGVGFTLAHQYLHQLDPLMRSAVLANAQSRVAFRLPSEDARVLASGSVLAAEDFQSLGAYECYVQAVAGGTVQPWCSARTLPAGTRLSDTAMIRAASRSAYGVDRASIEADLRELFIGRQEHDDSDLMPKRLNQGGSDE